MLIADIGELEKMDASEIHAWRLNAKEVFTPKNGEHFHIPDRRWNSQNYLEEIRFCENPLRSGTTQTEEKNKKVFWENQTGLHHHFKTHRRW